jgi:hypothetical protein
VAKALEVDTAPPKIDANTGTAAVITPLPAGSVRAVRKNSTAEVISVGDYCIREDRQYIKVCVPDENPETGRAKLYLPLTPTDPNGWTLSGTDDVPTLRPSICVNPPTGWHGFLTNGVFSSAQGQPQTTPTVPPTPPAPVSAPAAVKPAAHTGPRLNALTGRYE